MKSLCKRYERISASIFRKWGGLKRKDGKNTFSELDCVKKTTFFKVFLNQENVDNQTQCHLPTTKSAIWSFYTKDTAKYTQEDDQCFISQVDTSHMDHEHLMGRTYIPKCTRNTLYNVCTLYFLIGYIWTS